MRTRLPLVALLALVFLLALALPALATPVAVRVVSRSQPAPAFVQSSLLANLHYARASASGQLVRSSTGKPVSDAVVSMSVEGYCPIHAAWRTATTKPQVLPPTGGFSFATSALAVTLGNGSYQRYVVLSCGHKASRVRSKLYLSSLYPPNLNYALVPTYSGVATLPSHR